MKKNFTLLLMLIAYGKVAAQLSIYKEFNQKGATATCAERTIFVGDKIPNSLDNAAKSITLKKGFMATLAENEDGTGEGFNYMATVSDLSVNLAFVLQNKVSFIRVLPLPTTTVLKKGAGATNNDEVAALNVSWFYDWGPNDETTPTREFAPMAWGSGGASDAIVNSVIAKNSLTHFLAFNEPDNKGQSNITTTNAVPLYKNMLRSGLRMGSPACTEAQYRVWLSEFTNFANQDKLRIDFVAVHWYDWGTWLSGQNKNPNPVDVFNRFKNYINNVYALYQKPIWITEFNANVNRPPAVHEEFMKLALPYLDSDPRVERYAYFFGNDVPSRSNGVLTTAGQIYSSHVSTPANPENVYDKRPVYPEIVSWDTSAQLNGGESVTNFLPTYQDQTLTVVSGLTRGSGVSLTGLVSGGFWGGSEWSTSTAEEGITNKKFLTFSVKTPVEKITSIATINKFKIRIAANGPTKYQLDYQIDGGAFKPATTITGATATTANFSLGPIDLSKVEELQNIPPTKTITFRITPFASTGTGVFYFGAGATDTEADFSITGNITTLILGTESEINEPSNSSFLVYPTLSENRINVNFDKVSNDAKIRIFKPNGQLVSTHDLQQGASSTGIETSNLSQGIYLLTLENKGVIQTKRFVKE
jgi:Glycosyl hydrolase catalytic core/Secretion system C-terminal sorting domain